MVPSYFVQLPELPLTSNGKINRKALFKPESSISTGVEYVAPATNLELIISAIWQEVLNLDKIGVNDQFFNLGGNSLRLIKMNMLLNRELGKQIALIVLFQYPTIRSLAQYLTRQGNTDDSEKEALRKIDDSIQQMEQSLQLIKEVD